MALDDVKKTTIITKLSLYEWYVMPFGLKNTTSTFSQTMANIFKNGPPNFLRCLLTMLIYTMEHGVNIYVTSNWFFRN
jgi:hypothetical protein